MPNICAIPEVISLIVVIATHSGPVVGAALVHAEEGIKTSVGWGVSDIAMS